MTAIHATLIASAAVNVLTLWGWWDSIRALAHADLYADTLRRQRDEETLARIDIINDLRRLRLEWPRRDPVTGRYTKKV